MNVVIKPSPAFLRFRNSHHAVAQMFAAGWTISKVSHETGMSRKRLHILLRDPSFNDLIAEKRSEQESALEEHRDIFEKYHRGSMLLAAAEVYERLDTSAEEMPMRELMSVIKDGADRFGYSAKTVRVNIDASFATRLDRAIEASDKAKVIEHQPSQLATQPPQLMPPMVGARPLETPQAAAPPSVDAPKASPARALTNGFPRPVPSFVRVLKGSYA